MKRLFLIISLAISAMLIQAQQQCSDIIYLLDGDSISDCCITDVKVGNQITYYRKGKFKNIEAIAISKDGQYVDLRSYTYVENTEEAATNDPEEYYKGHNYDYYNEIYRKATVTRNLGMIFTLSGIGVGIGGVLLMSTNTTANAYAGLVISFVGFIVINVGVPIWLAGGVQRTNNRKVMEEIKRNMNLSLRTTNNGVGLVLNF